ncbi:hypothetical protein WMY93_002354 [Mugilogobius chulae]|uniref:RabBD domain-containing protein n=1 Tax=Mugilogobius chulae TaxID=88201 RepID=A0AAW0PV58_9GOBI
MATGKKLDLSKLTDEEAKHVWEVIQRDFDLRKKEEDRLGCSHYSKKEQNWVCHPCHMARVLKIGTLEWYHENVRSRFKRFGSAKVMRSLFKRLNGEPSGSESELRGQSDYDDNRSMPDVHTGGFEDNSIDQSNGHHYKEMKKPKRRLTVDPVELGLGFDYLSESRGRCYQAHSPSDSVSGFGKRSDYNNGGLDYSQGVESAISQHQVCVLRVWPWSVPLRVPPQLLVLWQWERRRSQKLRVSPRTEDSEEDEHFHAFPLYQSHQTLFSHTSQESLHSNNPQQITDLNRRMSAVESLLNRLEQKVTSPTDQLSVQTHTPSSVSPVPDWEVELEEQQLKQRLIEMTHNISDHSLSDEDEEEEDQHSRPESSQDIPAWRSPLQGDAFVSKIPTRPSSRLSSISSGAKMEDKGQHGDDNKSWGSLDRKSVDSQRFKGSTALLFELEDKVAQAAADVQNTQSQVSYIENKIAALNAAGMPVDKKKKSAIPVQARRLSQNFPTTQADRFVRNSSYRGSLTQRNPVKKPQPQTPCAKPVMTQGS